MLGLFRLMDYQQRERIEVELGVILQDLYDTVDDLRTQVLDFEQALDRIFEGNPEAGSGTPAKSR